MNKSDKNAKTITHCKKCNRVVYTTDVDVKGMCCNCDGSRGGFVSETSPVVQVVETGGGEDIVPRKRDTDSASDKRRRKP